MMTIEKGITSRHMEHNRKRTETQNLKFIATEMLKIIDAILRGKNLSCSSDIDSYSNIVVRDSTS